VNGKAANVRHLYLRIVALLVLGLAILSATLGATVAAPALPRATIEASLLLLEADRAVPVIITLRTADAEADIASLSATELSARAQRIGIARKVVFTRNASILTITKAQPTYAPLVFARMTPRQMDALADDAAIASIHPDRLSKPALYESTSIVGSATANAAGYTGAGTVVAVLDTGVKSSHIFLDGQVIAQACFSTTDSGQKSTSVCPGGASQAFGAGAGEPCPNECDHGTHVAGIIAGKQLTYGGQTFSGVAPAAKIIAVQVFSEFAKSECGVGATGPCVMSFESDQISALDWLYSERLTAGWGNLASINMSLGGGSYSTMASCNTDPLKPSVDTLRAAGIATVIASGNEDYLTSIGSPACISSAIAVGASTSDRTGTLDAPASFSNRPTAANNNPNALGDRLLDLMAPGNKIMSSIAESTTSFDDYPGTSMATPHVAGAWAVIKGIAPNASVTQVLGWLRETGKTIVDSRNGDPLSIPRINVSAAAAKAVDALTTSPTATLTKSKTPTKTRTSTRTATRNPKQSATKTRTKTRTSTRTATATATQIPTMTPSATALPAWSTSVTNGGFESMGAGWTEYSALGYALVSMADPSAGVYPRHGTYLAWLGGDDNETSTLSTSLSIPAAASYLRLHTWARSQETNCSNDVATVKVNSILVSTIPLCYATNSTLSYIPFSIDVTALRGQSSIPLEIKVVTNSSLVSHFLVDDIGYVSAPTDSIYRIPYGVLTYRTANDSVLPKRP
jgi:hypothetical protein